MIWGSKCHQKHYPDVCNGYVKYDEAEVDGLVAILKTKICGGGGGPCGIQQAARLGEVCLIVLTWYLKQKSTLYNLEDDNRPIPL